MKGSSRGGGSGPQFGPACAPRGGSHCGFRNEACNFLGPVSGYSALGGRRAPI